MEALICQKCGSPNVELIPKDGVWGKEYKNKKGGTFHTFSNCKDCGWKVYSKPKGNQSPSLVENTAKSPINANTETYDALEITLRKVVKWLEANTDFTE